MPTPLTIEEKVKALLDAKLSTPPDSRITHAYRLQDSTLPAVTFEVSNVQTASIDGLLTASVAVTCIDDTTKEAADLAATVAGAFVPYQTIQAVIYQGTTIEPPVVGFTDEQQPASAVVSLLIYYTNT